MTPVIDDRCPCGGRLYIDDDVEKEVRVAPAIYIVGRSDLERRRVRVTVLACTDCEFVSEVEP
jgi:hypothetical protein